MDLDMDAAKRSHSNQECMLFKMKFVRMNFSIPFRPLMMIMMMMTTLTVRK